VREEQKPADPEETGEECDTSDKERNIGLLGLVGPSDREGERVEIGLLDGILEYPVVFVSFSFFFF